MGKWTILAGAAGSGSLTFGKGFNVNGTSVTWALDDPSNMLNDPGFEDTPDLAQWEQEIASTATPTSGVFSIETSIFFQGARSAKCSTADRRIQQRFHCDPGDQFTLSIFARTSSGATGNGSCRVGFYDASGVVISGSVATTTFGATTTWTQHKTDSITAPSNAAFVMARCLVVEPGATGTWYVDNASLRRINAGDTIQVGAIETDHLAAGSLGDLSKYSSTVRAIGITSGTPTLPNANYPNGAIIFNTADGKIYRNVSGTWSKGTAPADIIAGTLAAGVVYAGQINCSQINAGTLVAGVVYAGDINASQITAGTINASVIAVTHLNASNITTGTLSADFITGGTMNVGAGGIEIDGGDLIIGTGDLSVLFGNITLVGGSAYVQCDHLVTVNTAGTGVDTVVQDRKTGWTRPTGTATRSGYATGTATLTQVAETLKALIDDVHSISGHGLIGT